MFEAHLCRSLDRLPRRGPYAVAYSGGSDSLALLHAMASLRDRCAVQGVLRAVHVNHGMQPDADSWVDTCRVACARLDLPLSVLRVQVDGDGRGPEAAARHARYRALAAELGAGEILCTAHHRDDQAETVLVQLARGGGPRGLAGAVRWAALGRGWLARPLLDLPRAVLAAHARGCGLAWVEDPSNTEEGLARSHLRASVLPSLRRHWPGVDRALARAARHQGECADLLEALAELDLRASSGPVAGTISRAACRAMGEVRAANLLRHWIRSRGLPPPAERHVRGILHDVVASRDDATPKVDWPGAEIRRYRDGLYALAPAAANDMPGPLIWDSATTLVLPHGRLELRRESGRGLDAMWALPRLEVRFRRGGERCHPAGQRHGHSLKRVLQERGVAPWERGRIPLIFRGGVLVAVAGLLVCEGFQARPGDEGYFPTWDAASGPPLAKPGPG